MECSKTTTVVINFSITEQEARVLKDLLQNPVTNNEPSACFELRLAIFTKLIRFLGEQSQEATL